MSSRNAPVPQLGPTNFLQRGLLLVGVVLLSGASGCVVAPWQPGPVVVAQPRVQVQVAPTYASPGVGWVWIAHPNYGWGWHHPSHGWHRGWR